MRLPIPAGVGLAAVIALLAFAPKGEAQQPVRLAWRTDLTALNQYYWRGIRRSLHPVLQGDAALGLTLGPVTLAVGGWGNLEPEQPTWATESSYWAEAGLRTASLVLVGGVARSFFPRPDATPDVTEAYGRIRWESGRLVLSTPMWIAVDGAEGAYLEPAVSFYHLVNPFTGPAFSWNTTLRAGIQAGSRNPDYPGIPGPVETGVTRVALATRLRVQMNLVWELAAILEVAPELDLNLDPATRVGTHDPELRGRVPLSIGVSAPFRRPE